MVAAGDGKGGTPSFPPSQSASQSTLLSGDTGQKPGADEREAPHQMDSQHPNDLMEFAQYPDEGAGLRQTYPPLPRKGLNVNAVDAKGIVMGLHGQVGKQLPFEVTQQIAKCHVVIPIPDSVANTPEVEQLKAAGWL